MAVVYGRGKSRMQLWLLPQRNPPAHASAGAQEERGTVLQMAWTERTEGLIGKDGLARLRAAHILLFGTGGVGSFVAEGLVRSGLGQLTLVDPDVVAESNLNRQLPARLDSIGRPKVQAMAEELYRISCDTVLHPLQSRLDESNADDYLSASVLSTELRSKGSTAVYDLVIDAIDDIPAKRALALACARKGQPLLSCGGCGRRLDPSKLELTDLFKTEGDPLLKKLRKLLREAGLRSLPLVASREPARELPPERSGPSSMIFVPAAAGLLLASTAVRHLLGEQLIEPPGLRP